jgi:AraC family transcriptional regulator, transcriptional activator of pobA
VKRLRIPFRGLDDHPNASEAEGVFVGKFESTTRALPNRLQLHRHNYFEIFRLDGNGAHFNDFEVYPIREPTLVFVSPGQIHRWYDGYRLYGHLVCFTQQFFDGDVPPPSPLLKYSFWYPDEIRPILPIASEAREMDALFNEMESEFEKKDKDFEGAIGALLRLLFVRVERLYQRADIRIEPGRDSTLVRDFRLTLEKHFHTTQSVSEYARLLKISATYLGGAVHERTGRQAGDIIRQRVLLEAKRLLAHTEMTVSEVAYSLNFQDPAYFSRFFRRLTGQPPGEFRESLSQKYPY